MENKDDNDDDDVPLFQVAIEADYFCIKNCIYHLQSLLFCATKSLKNPFYKNYLSMG